MSRQEHQGSSLRTVLVVIFAIAAWHSHPDDQHFERWRQRELGSHERNFDDEGLHVTAKAGRERTTFGLFSIVTAHDSQARTYVGAFGRWWRFPAAQK